MIPVGHELEDEQRRPYATITLIAVTTAIALILGGESAPIDHATAVQQYGLVPERLWRDPAAAWPTLITYAFLHGDALHLATNMLFLWVFGRGLEREMGWRYLPFYLFAAMAAGLVSAALRADSMGPTIGASGAVSGVLGAYLILLPNATIRALILLPWTLGLALLRGESPIWGVPAWAAILTWFVLQIVEAAAPGGGARHVDHAAHFGGFIAGYGVIRLAREYLGLWPDEPEVRRLLDVPADEARPLPNSYVRASRPIQPGQPIQRDDIEWVAREGRFVDANVIPGRDGKLVIGRRLRAPRYRYEPIRWDDLVSNE